MKKIIVIGSGGSGKSTFARSLGALLQLPVIHLDALHWQPGWVEMPKDKWRATVAELVQRDEWVIDGNYSGTLGLRLAACDTVILLDLPRPVCLWRACKRAFTYRNQVRPDMAPGCPEKFDLKFLLWIWGFPRRTRPKILALLAEAGSDKTIIRLTSTNEVERFWPKLRPEGRPQTTVTD